MFGFGKREKRELGYKVSELTPDGILFDETPEQRAGFTNVITDPIERNACIQAAVSFMEKAFRAAEVAPDSARESFSPGVLGMIARRLLLKGECVFLIEVKDGKRHLVPTTSHNVQTGSYDPETWRYEITLPGPDASRSIVVPAERVMHFRVGEDTSMPWKGRSPLQVASATVSHIRLLEDRLVKEGKRPSGDMFVMPKGSKEDMERLTNRIDGRGGETGIVDNSRLVVGTNPATSGQQTSIQHYGSAIDPQLRELRDRLVSEIVSALGVPPELLAPGQGSASREGYRRFVYAGAVPLASGISREAQIKGDWPDFNITFNDLAAADLRTRSNAFKQFMEAGLSADNAARLCGLSLE